MQETHTPEDRQNTRRRKKHKQTEIYTEHSNTKIKKDMNKNTNKLKVERKKDKKHRKERQKNIKTVRKLRNTEKITQE